MWEKYVSSGCLTASARRFLLSCHPERFVQAIRGLLLGFRRDDSVISKTWARSKQSAQYFCRRFWWGLRATGKLRLCSYALHINTVKIWCASVALNFLRRLRLCARGYNNTPKSFSCELFAFLELRRVGWHCCPWCFVVFSGGWVEHEEFWENWFILVEC